MLGFLGTEGDVTGSEWAGPSAHEGVPGGWEPPRGRRTYLAHGIDDEWKNIHPGYTRRPVAGEW